MKKEEINALTMEQLDEEVHKAKSSEAANINNEGREAQVRYLLEHYGLTEIHMLTIKLPITYEEMDRELLRATLQMDHGVMVHAANHLGIDRRTIYRKSRKHQLGPYKNGEMNATKVG